MSTALLQVVAVTALAFPIPADSRRQTPPSPVSILPIATTASRRAAAALLEEQRAFDDKILPPEILLTEATHSRDVTELRHMGGVPSHAIPN